MLSGILLIGVGVALFRLAGFGADPFTGMNLGISMFLNWSFGNWQLIANGLILAIVFFKAPECIGPGTIVNMVGVGYTADLICWLLSQTLPISLPIVLRILFLAAGLLFMSFGAALYMEGDLGIAPYDSVAIVMEQSSDHRIPFHIARMISDTAAVAAGAVFCVAGGYPIWSVIGIGTICNAMLNGTAIQFFRNRLRRGFPARGKS